MSRATRRYKKWERGMREWARESSRELALDLYYCRPRPLSSYGVGVSLEPGEILFREVWARYWTLSQPTELVDNLGRTRFVSAVWRDWGWCQTLLTSCRKGPTAKTVLMSVLDLRRDHVQIHHGDAEVLRNTISSITKHEHELTDAASTLLGFRQPLRGRIRRVMRIRSPHALLPSSDEDS